MKDEKDAFWNLNNFNANRCWRRFRTIPHFSVYQLSGCERKLNDFLYSFYLAKWFMLIETEKKVLFLRNFIWMRNEGVKESKRSENVGEGSDFLIVDCNKLKLAEKLRFMGNYKNLTKCFPLSLPLCCRHIFCFFCYLRRRIYRASLSALRNFLRLSFQEMFFCFVHEFLLLFLASDFNWKSWYSTYVRDNSKNTIQTIFHFVSEFWSFFCLFLCFFVSSKRD